MDEYRGRYEAGAMAAGTDVLRPGRLASTTPDGIVLVEDGDTLICACSRAAAARGECHRVFAAPLLAAAGWRVVLDGREVASCAV